jgi:hypothetical protein
LTASPVALKRRAHRRDTEEFRKAADMTDDELAAIVAKARLTVVK